MHGPLYVKFEVCKYIATSMQNTTKTYCILYTLDKTGHDYDNSFNMNDHVWISYSVQFWNST